MNKDADIRAYNLAKTFLLEKTPEIDEKIIDHHYLNPSNPADTIPDLYLRLLSSAQNANRKAGVIGGSIGGVEKLSKVLINFNPTAVTQRYGKDYMELLVVIKTELKPNGTVSGEPRSIWLNYCRTILEAAEFFLDFHNAPEFYDWVNHYYKDEKSLDALPMILAEKIHGIGPVLACDFLKELGFVKYGKPDVHIKEIFEALSLVKPKSSDAQVLKAIQRIAGNVGVTPYNVDKLFWLIGSGYFYKHLNIGKKGRVEGWREGKKMFIKYWEKDNIQDS